MGCWLPLQEKLRETVGGSMLVLHLPRGNQGKHQQRNGKNMTLDNQENQQKIFKKRECLVGRVTGQNDQTKSFYSLWTREGEIQLCGFFQVKTAHQQLAREHGGGKSRLLFQGEQKLAETSKSALDGKSVLPAVQGNILHNANSNKE